MIPINVTVMYLHCIIDIDECVTGTHSCQQRCINTEGSYNCSCYNGFMKRFELFCFGMLIC